MVDTPFTDPYLQTPHGSLTFRLFSVHSHYRYTLLDHEVWEVHIIITSIFFFSGKREAISTDFFFNEADLSSSFEDLNKHVKP